MHAEMHIWPGGAWELWATFNPLRTKEESQVVAIFLSEESAKAYLAGSRLATKKIQFRKSSLLRYAIAAWIQKAEEIPIEPTL